MDEMEWTDGVELGAPDRVSRAQCVALLRVRPNGKLQ